MPEPIEIEAAVQRSFNIGMMQIPSEISALMMLVQSMRPMNVLEIGTAFGGTFALWCAAARGKKVSLDLPEGPFGGVAWDRARARTEAMQGWASDVYAILGDSRSVDVIEQVRNLVADEGIDFLFIDGDHSYDGVRMDFENYGPMVNAGGAIAFHDIVQSPRHVAAGCFVGQFWEALPGNKLELKSGADWGGIGVLLTDQSGGMSQQSARVEVLSRVLERIRPLRRDVAGGRVGQRKRELRSGSSRGGR